MSPPRRRGAVITAMAAVIVVLTTTGAMAATTITPDSTVGVTAYFPDAAPLVSGNEVKAAGVVVGSIDEVSLENGLAKVEMTVGEEVLPLHEDATARIVVQDLLGERFVTIDRGGPTTPERPEPYVIDVDQTSRGVDLQEVLNAVDDPTGTALAATITTLGEGLDARGADTAAAITALAPAMEQTGELAGILGDQNEVLGELVDRARPVADGLAADEGRTLDGLVDSATATLGTIGDREQQLAATLQELPGTITSARGTLAELAGVTDPTARTLASLRPTTSKLTEVSAELRRFSEAADPALASLPEVLRKGEELLDEAGPLVRALRPAGPHLKSITPDLKFLTDEALSLRLTNLMEFVKGWSMATSDYDAISHYFKATLVLTPQALGTAGGGLIPGAPNPVPALPLPGAPGATPAVPPDGTPAPGNQTGEGGSLPAGEAPTDNNRGPDAQTARSDGSATGLEQEQEGAMVDQLLGGGF